MHPEGDSSKIKEIKKTGSVIPVERVERTILVIRGQKVILDADLARLFGVPTKRLNQQVNRNRDRFPADFIFQLTEGEKTEVVANCDHLARLKFSPVLPYAFTEHGAIMVASILNTPRAIEASVFVVRAFVKLRGMMAAHEELAAKLRELENRIQDHDEQIVDIFEAIRQLMNPPRASEEENRVRSEGARSAVWETEEQVFKSEISGAMRS